MFSSRVESLAVMAQAIASHATRLGGKLRRQALGTDYLSIFYTPASMVAAMGIIDQALETAARVVNPCERGGHSLYRSPTLSLFNAARRIGDSVSERCAA
jgi:hypothetical protein